MSLTSLPSLLHVSFDLPEFSFLSDVFRHSGLLVTEVFMGEINKNDVFNKVAFDYIVINALTDEDKYKTDRMTPSIEKVCEYTKVHSKKVLFLLPQESPLLKNIQSQCPTAAIL